MRVRCVSFDQKTKGDRATVRKFSTGRPWFSNSSNVHIVRPAACEGSCLYWTYLLGLMKETVLSRTAALFCCPKWRGRTTICLGKRQNIASAMQLNGSYGRKKIMCAIFFFAYYYYYFQNSGASSDDFFLNAFKTLLRLSRVIKISECILLIISATINLIYVT